MASLAAAESLLLVDNSQMPYHGNQRIQPNDTSSRPAQVHCDRYDDVVDLITQVDLAGKTYFSHYADQGMIIARVVAVFKRPKNADKIAVFCRRFGCLENKQAVVHCRAAGLPKNWAAGARWLQQPIGGSRSDREYELEAQASAFFGGCKRDALACASSLYSSNSCRVSLVHQAELFAGRLPVSKARITITHSSRS